MGPVLNSMHYSGTAVRVRSAEKKYVRNRFQTLYFIWALESFKSLLTPRALVYLAPSISKNEEGMPFRVREMAGLIKSRLEREWAAWEVDVLERVAYDAEEVR